VSAAPVHAPDGHRQPTRRRPLSGGQIAMIVVGSIVALLGLGLLGGGVAVAAAGHSRDSAGYLTTGPATVASTAYAVTAPNLGVDVRGPDEAYARDLLGTVRIRATASEPVFLGIARTADVQRYLDGVGHDEISDIDVDPVRVEYAEHAGGAPELAPGEQTFWELSDSGTGTRTLEWQLATGDWTVVVMNADGSPGVRADLDLGGTLPVLRGVTIGLLVAGSLLLLGGAVLILLPLLTRRPEPV
jgi:hypothetical protein